MKVKVWVVLSVAVAMCLIALMALVALVRVIALDDPSLSLDATSAAWVQAVGSVVALLFAVWLPAHARRQDRKQVREVRIALLAVLLADVENLLKNCGLHDRASIDRAVRFSLEKVDVFLGGESDLQIATEMLKIREELTHLYNLVGSAHLDDLWISHSSAVLERLQQSRQGPMF